jgi:hypothetical protein
MATKEELNDILKLAEFARVETPEQARTFEQRHPDFFPIAFWPWERSTLPEPFGGAFLGGYEWTTYQQILREAWKARFPLGATVRLVAPSGAVESSELIMDGKVHPYQRAVMLMHIEPWRAAHCMKCGLPFAKDAKGRLYCSSECYGPARSEAKSDWWRKNGNKWRAKRKKSHKTRGK